MGQGLLTPTSFRVSVFEPVLVPACLGQPFVILRARVAGRLLEERIESFPAVRSFPVHVLDGEVEPRILEVEVVAADLESFREGGGVHHFQGVPVPLRRFSRVLAPQSASDVHSASVWLGLADELAATAELDEHQLFDQACGAGARLVCPKVAISFHGMHDDAPAEAGRLLDALGLPNIGNGCAPLQRPEAAVSERTGSRLVAEHAIISWACSATSVLHQLAMQASAASDEREALSSESAQLRAAIGKQRERCESAIAQLRSRLPADYRSTGSSLQERSDAGPWKAPQDLEARRAASELEELNGHIGSLRAQLREARALEPEIQQKGLAARRAAEELRLLAEEKEQELQALDAELCESSAAHEQLRLACRRLKADLVRGRIEEPAISSLEPRGVQQRYSAR